MRLVPIVIPETHNQTKYKVFARVRPDGYCDCSVKTANTYIQLELDRKAVGAVQRVKEIFGVLR